MSKTLIDMETARLKSLLGGDIASRTELTHELDDLESERAYIEQRIDDIERRLNTLYGKEALPTTVAEQVLTCAVLYEQYGYEAPAYVTDLAKRLPEEVPA